jgi:hypothetical protein
MAVLVGCMRPKRGDTNYRARKATRGYQPFDEGKGAMKSARQLRQKPSKTEFIIHIIFGGVLVLWIVLTTLYMIIKNI